MDGWTNGWMDGGMDGWVDEGWMDRWMDGWRDEEMNGWMDGLMDGWAESVRSGQLAWRELGTHLLGLPVLQTCSHGHCVSTGTAGDRGTSGADLQPQQ